MEMRQRIRPFTATALVILLDQLTKYLIILRIPPYTVGWSSGPGEFFRIIHVKNTAVAFSLGSSFPDGLRTVLFILLPVVIITSVTVYLIKSDEFTSLQRWSAALMLGGGLGNLIDRIFRPDGVVDFLDVKFYGLFGLERWPTFNVADSSVVIGAVLLVLSLLFEREKDIHE
jgi:signal peptidase II